MSTKQPEYWASDPQARALRVEVAERATEAVDACRYLGGLIRGAVSGADKDELLSADYAPVTECWRKHPLSPAIAEIAGSSFKRREPPEVMGSGSVVKSLEAALWAFHKTDNFRDGALLAGNLGDDADTTGAVSPSPHARREAAGPPHELEPSRRVRWVGGAN
jgi:ADP-ribosyl-[dinitrogen reductase] hydrolase